MASYWLYNGSSYPALPDWVKDYAYITLHDPNLGDTYIVATNDIEVRKANNITYGVWHDTFAIGGVVSTLNIDSWREPITREEEWLGGQSPYMDHSYRARWSNVDLPCAEDDGTEYVILAGSNPIDKETGEEIQLTPSIEPDKPPEETVTSAPAPDPTSMLMGWLVGRAIAGQRWKKAEPSEPIAYLYNGVQLPKLPEWDREAYPYAVIGNHWTGLSLQLHVSQTSIYNESGGYVYVDTPRQGWQYKNGIWEGMSLDPVDSMPLLDAIWTNTDIHNEDGTLYLAASEPVPVYA